MCKKMCLLISFVLLLALAGNASAIVVVYWDDGDPCDHLWSSPNNWNPDGAPGTDYQCRVNPPAATAPNGPVIDGGTNECQNLIVGWAAGDANLTINSGTLKAGHGGTANGCTIGHSFDSVAVLDMNGGHLIVDGAEFRVAFQDSTGTINVNGGAKLSSLTTMHVAWNAWKPEHTTKAYVYLNDGEIHTTALSFESDPGAAGILEGRMYINDNGTLYVSGNKVASLQGYIGSGHISYIGSLPNGELKVEYPVDGNTVVYAYAPDMNLATNPSPADYSTVNLYEASTLTWTPGINADQHKVHFGTTSPPPEAPGQPQSPNNFSPTGLALGETYYWRIDEVNGATTWTGPEWRFTLDDYIVVDDFETYNTVGDLSGVWSAGDGAVLDLSTTIAHGGTKAMELTFWNNYGTYKSSASRTPPDPNWLKAGTKALYMWYKGDPNANKLEVKLNTGSAVVPTGITPTSTAWQQGRIALADFGATLTNVTSLTITVGDGTNAGTGTVYIDDISLYPTRCIIAPTGGDLNGDCTIDFKDLAVMGNNWLDTGIWP